MLFLRVRRAAKRTPDTDADPCRVLRRYRDARVPYRHNGSTDGELRTAVEATDGFRVEVGKERGGVEIGNFGGNTRRKEAGVKTGQRTYAGLAAQNTLPQPVRPAPNARYGTETGDNDAARSASTIALIQESVFPAMFETNSRPTIQSANHAPTNGTG